MGYRIGFLAAVLTTATLVTFAPTYAQEYLKRWESVPSGKGALVVFVDDAASMQEMLLLEDKSGLVLDKAERVESLPLFRKYLLEPGSYDLFLGDWDTPIDLEIDAGKVDYLRLASPRPSSLFAALMAGEISASFSDVSDALLKAENLSVAYRLIAPIPVKAPARTLRLKLGPRPPGTDDPGPMRPE